MLTPRREILETQAAVHGGRQFCARDTARKIPAERDFSVCLNAFGPAPIVAEAVRASAVEEYPDPYSRAPRQAVAYRWDRPMDEVVFGAGAAELIQAVCFAYLSRGDSVVIASPSFGEYDRAAKLCGAEVHHVRTSVSGTENSMWDNAMELVSAVFQARPRLMFMASPSSPSGAQYPPEVLRQIANTCARCDCLLILDQSYDTFAEHPLGTPAVADNEHVVHIRSLTKDHALAGVRAAFAVVTPEVAAHIERARVPWSASTVAQAAAVAAMSNEALQHVAHTTALLRTEARRIADACISAGYVVEDSCTHYMLVRCRSAATAREMLVDHHDLLVRDCTSFGLPNHIRVAARKPEDNSVLIEALRRISVSQKT